MMTLRRFAEPPESLPTSTSWYLADLGMALGKQELLTRKSPQVLKALREHALIQSAISSNRIEGVEVDRDRVQAVVLGKAPLRDRDEEEVRGYRDALQLIHESHSTLAISEETICRLHALSRSGSGDAGEYKQRDSDIIEVLPSGRRQVRFRTVEAADTPGFMQELIQRWIEIIAQRAVPPIIAMAAFNLDFLCIHPFRDGNGRVSRLLLLLMAYQQGLEVGRYVSLERLIEENKDRYYETLKLSSAGWHKANHEPWHYVNFVLYTLLGAYAELEHRAGQTAVPRGAKTTTVLQAIRSQRGQFRIVDIEQLCPGVGRDWIRAIIASMRKSREVICRGRGPAARWELVRSKGTTS